MIILSLTKISDNVFQDNVQKICTSMNKVLVKNVLIIVHIVVKKEYVKNVQLDIN